MQRRQQDRSGESLAVALGWFSIGLGVAELIVPESVAKLIGVRADSKAAATLRALGAREIGHGVSILADPSSATRMWARVGGDTIDMAFIGAAMADERTDRTKLAIATAAVMGVGVADLLCAMRLGDRSETERGQKSSRRWTEGKGVRIERVTTINRPIEEVYAFWKNFENFPKFMRHIENVHMSGPRRSHWHAKAPAGMTVAWEAETLEDRENEWIAWRSVEGSQIQNSGSVRFQRAPGARGTEVRVQLQYTPPGGRLGRAVAWMFGEEPDQQIHEDLHRFKQLMETGEIPMSDGPSLWRAAQPAADPNELRTRAGVTR
jgi:uncharacterized membrane protein